MRRTAAAAALIVVTGILAACGSPGPSYYVATSPGEVDLITWNPPQNGQASGTITSDTIATNASDPSAPDSLAVDTAPVTVTFSGSTVIIAGFLGGSLTGSLGDGSLTVTELPNATTGQIISGTFQASGPATYNADVAALNKRIKADNAQAAAAAQAQQRQQANTQAEDTASNDLAALEQAGSFTGDLRQLASDVTGTNNDLAAEQQAAQAGVNGPGGPACYNLENNVDYDAVNNVEYDATENLGYDLSQHLVPDIATARSDIATLDNAEARLAADGLPATAGAAAALAAARRAVAEAVKAANGYITQVNNDVATAYSLANGMATGGCTGPGATPAPIGPVS